MTAEQLIKALQTFSKTNQKRKVVLVDQKKNRWNFLERVEPLITFDEGDCKDVKTIALITSEITED